MLTDTNISVDFTSMDESVSFDFKQTGWKEGTIIFTIGNSNIEITLNEDQFDRFQRLISDCAIDELTK